MTTPETTAPDTVRLEPCEVTQEDRIEAADLLDAISSLLDHTGIGQVADLIRDGEYDEHEAVQAFARHRLNTRPLSIPQGEEVERITAVSESAISCLKMRSPLNRVIFRAVSGYRMSNMVDGEGFGYPLLDLMSNPAPSDIGTGEMEMVALVDEIESAVEAALASMSPTLSPNGEGEAPVNNTAWLDEVFERNREHLAKVPRPILEAKFAHIPDGVAEDDDTTTCEGCGKVILRGQFIHCYDEGVEVHVDCSKPNAFSDDPGAAILVGDPMLRVRLSALSPSLVEKVKELQSAYDSVSEGYEINVGNYNHDDACHLNNGYIQMSQVAEEALSLLSAGAEKGSGE